MAATSALMKLDLCGFSGYKIYPGKGKRYARVDGKVFNFISQKAEHSFLMRRNPRKICWTVLYRRKHKKGTNEEVVKKRTRRTQKFQRAIQGATLESIMAKRNQKPEVRKAQREQLIRQAKEKSKSSQQKKAATKPASAARGATAGKKAQKVVKGAAPRVGGKR